MKTVVSKLNNINQIFVVRCLLASVVIIMFTYLYLVKSTVFSAAAYEDISDDIIQTQSEIGELELVYIQKTRNIERELSEEFALVETSNSDTIFTKRNVATKLTFND